VVVYTGLALFAGGGGLELGLKLALGDRYKCVAFVERSIEAAAVLATNMERPEAGLDKGVIWDDVTTFTGDIVSPFVDNIDIMSAGFPCQPWSVAGSRRKTDDDRWLWPHIFRLVREIRPRNIFLENVPGLLHGGIEHVLGDLASVGFDAEWISVRASDVGAPHRRERVFILANSTSERPREAGRYIERPSTRATSDRTALGITSSSGRSTGRHREREHEVRHDRNGQDQEDIELRGVGQSRTGEGSEALGNTSVEGRQGKNSIRQPKRFTEGRSELDNTNSQRLEGGARARAKETRSGQTVGTMGNANSQRRRTQGDSELTPAGIGGGCRPFPWPPSPGSTEDWREVIEVRPDLAPAVKPEVRGMDDGVARGLARTQQLRILGNGVVPQQAALAFQILKERIDGSTTTSK